MSTQSTPESDSSTAATTDQRFSWAQVDGAGPRPSRARPTPRRGLDDAGRPRVELGWPIQDRSEFVSVALPAGSVDRTAFVVGYLLDEVDGHRLPEHEVHEDWTVTVHGDVSDWLDVARAATDRLEYQERVSGDE